MSLFQALAELEQKHQSAALCTVVKTSGSTPRHSTSKMLVYPDGHILGTVGGGELENRVVKEALDSLQDGKPRNLAYNMADPARGDPGLCGGQVEVFVEPILPSPMLVVSWWRTCRKSRCASRQMARFPGGCFGRPHGILHPRS